MELYGAALRLFGAPYSGIGRSCKKPARIVRTPADALVPCCYTPVPATLAATATLARASRGALACRCRTGGCATWARCACQCSCGTWRNPAGSMWVFNNNVRLACCEVYGLLHQLRGANAEATRAVLQYCEGSDWNDEMDEDLELAQQEHRRRDSTELILALLLAPEPSPAPLLSVPQRHGAACWSRCVLLGPFAPARPRAQQAVHPASAGQFPSDCVSSGQRASTFACVSWWPTTAATPVRRRASTSTGTIPVRTLSTGWRSRTSSQEPDSARLTRDETALGCESSESHATLPPYLVHLPCTRYH